MKYDSTVLDPPGPMLDVLIRPMSSSEPVHTMRGKLDSGADITLIPSSLITEFELAPRYRIFTRSYVGGQAERVGYEVDLEIAGYKIESVPVVAVPRSDILLGRDVLNHFIITLDGKALEFDLRDP